ncbi:endonuclease YncB(thermonuclease family) [Pseudomonas duriflava]|uniref:Endonuclease YncB(Thermonuclease family) n=1 Tax=Pseudomonas duriflava TaxID=459528 RepID=A0A562QFE2_9PSED|nr:thermonuclease family protein [Pseudomonas duriflava]TWI55458.1 endonuclease YncB(thermonuclease family) [Pseudomonas duriflava]
MKRLIATAALILVPWLASAQNQTLECRVVGVHDGDTLTCLTAQKKQLKVRLGEIDTPETKQPYGTRAQQSLSALVFGKDVRLTVQDTDRYGRKVARVYQGKTDVNAEQVKSGSAWVYRQYLKDKSLLNLEAEAKAAKRGLWALPEAERMPPWEWRKADRDKRQAQREGTATYTPPVKDETEAADVFNCSALKACKAMSSCAEAKYQLQHCGNTKIDGNRDGIPCEALCR